MYLYGFVSYSHILKAFSYLEDPLSFFNLHFYMPCWAPVRSMVPSTLERRPHRRMSRGWRWATLDTGRDPCLPIFLVFFFHKFFPIHVLMFFSSFFMFDWLAYILVLCIEKSMCTSHSVAMIEVLLRRDKCCPFRSPEACARLFFFCGAWFRPHPEGNETWWTPYHIASVTSRQDSMFNFPQYDIIWYRIVYRII